MMTDTEKLEAIKEVLLTDGPLIAVAKIGKIVFPEIDMKEYDDFIKILEIKSRA